MRGHPGEQGAGLVGAPTSGRERRGRERADSETGQCDRMAGQVSDRTEHLGGDVVEAIGDGAEQFRPRPAVGPQPAGRLFEGPHEHGRDRVVERVRQIDFGVTPFEPVRGEVEGAEEGRRHPHRVDCRAVVVQQARGQSLGGAGAAPDRVGGLVDGDPHPAQRERHRRGQSVGAGADDDSLGHRTASPR